MTIQLLPLEQGKRSLPPTLRDYLTTGKCEFMMEGWKSVVARWERADPRGKGMEDVEENWAEWRMINGREEKGVGSTGDRGNSGE